MPVNVFMRRYDLVPRETGEYAVIRKNGMKYITHAYEIPGIGRISYLQMTAMLGLMKMEMSVISPLEADAPLCAVDYIHVMGKDTLFIELYDTQLSWAPDFSALEKVKARYAALPDVGHKPCWYDAILYPVSVFKAAKKHRKEFDLLMADYLKEYTALLDAAPACSRAEKQQKVWDYTDHLLRDGGPSTQQFVKMIGAEATREYYMKYIFSGEG